MNTSFSPITHEHLAELDNLLLELQKSVSVKTTRFEVVREKVNAVDSFANELSRNAVCNISDFHAPNTLNKVPKALSFSDKLYGSMELLKTLLCQEVLDCPAFRRKLIIFIKEMRKNVTS